MPIHQLPARPDATKTDEIYVVVESPQGSAQKLKYEPALGLFTPARVLPLGLVYPYDWGFVPGTMAADGDPLDAMVLGEVPSYPGVVHRCHPLGAAKFTQKSKDGGRERNDRLITLPTTNAHHYDNPHDARDLSEQLRNEIRAFFETAVLFLSKDLEFEGWAGPEDGIALIDRSIAAFKAEKSAYKTQTRPPQK